MTCEQWNASYGPFDEYGTPLASDEHPLTVAIREGRPAYARLRIRGERRLLEVEAGALPCWDRPETTGRWSFSGPPERMLQGRADAGQTVGVRGSIPVRGSATKRFGGNTSCVQVTAADGSEFVLDAGTQSGSLGRRSRAAAGACTSCSPICTSITSRA